MPVVRRKQVLPPSRTKWAWLQCALIIQARRCESGQWTQAVYLIRGTGGRTVLYEQLNKLLLLQSIEVVPQATACAILYHLVIAITFRTWMYNTVLMYVNVHFPTFDLTWSPHLTLLFYPLMTDSDKLGWDHMVRKSALPSHLPLQITLSSVKLCLS